MKCKLRLTDFSGMLLDNHLKPLSLVGMAYVDIGVQLTSDWLMGAAVLSNILM